LAATSDPAITMMSRAPVYKPVRSAGLATFVASCAWTTGDAEDVAGSIIVWRRFAAN
jgi:hypothetical protein